MKMYNSQLKSLIAGTLLVLIIVVGSGILIYRFAQRRAAEREANQETTEQAVIPETATTPTPAPSLEPVHETIPAVPENQPKKTPVAGPEIWAPEVKDALQ